MSVLDVMALDPQQMETLADLLVEAGELSRTPPDEPMTPERWRRGE